VRRALLCEMLRDRLASGFRDPATETEPDRRLVRMPGDNGVDAAVCLCPPVHALGGMPLQDGLGIEAI